MKRRRLDGAARRDQLVEVGLTLARTTPFDQISADEVARIAGVSKGLVFHYFPTTRDLQVAVLRAGIRELMDDLDLGHSVSVYIGHLGRASRPGRRSGTARFRPSPSFG